MRLIKLSKQGKIVRYPYSVSMLQFENPNISFPENLTADMLVGFNVFEVLPITPPFAEYNQKVEETNPVKKDGKWYQAWKVVDLSEKELNDVIKLKAEEVKKTRNQLLTDCDWTQLPDSSADQKKWLEYRRKLRDITKQKGFPFGVIWPNPPV
jgi:hypothetical protein